MKMEDGDKTKPLIAARERGKLGAISLSNIFESHRPILVGRWQGCAILSLLSSDQVFPLRQR